ncbi:ABC transporter permease [Massilia sp. TSP1-1-2]|uniref:ABC transporter permease n=1 Tax=Massilia sp. TSP1-1-2 TaxID=2804649 RepID=UPI003CF9E9CF
MLSPRWIKLLRDAQATPGRIALMVLAIAAGVCGMATMLSSYTILSRETTRNYLDTNPPSATMQLDRIDAPLMAAVRRFPGIADAQASSIVGAAVQVGAAWLPLTIFVVDDFSALRINTVYREAGAWPPPPATLLLERDVLPMMGARIGAPLKVRTADGVQYALAISGTLHDPALPPASRGSTVYAYATAATVAGMGLDGDLRQLKLKVRDRPFDIEAIEASVAPLALWLQSQGRSVEQIRIPPPGQHPHQKVMSSITFMLLIFSGIACVLSAMLTATMLGSMLAQQTRQIGVMKTIGARTTQIAVLYLSMVLMIGLLATALGTWAGLAAGRAFSAVVLRQILNFTMFSDALPWSSYLLLAATGVLVPLLLATVPIWQASQMTVLAAITDFGSARQDYPVRARWLNLLPWLDRNLLMALRNSFRRRSRLLFILALLAMAGAMFVSSLNVRKASQQHLVEAALERHYDMEIALNRFEAIDAVCAIIGAVPGVAQVEPWNSSATSKARADGLEIERVYPDGVHGSLSMAAPPLSSTMLKLSMREGHWLRADQPGTVVLNSAALDFFPHVKVGDDISLASHGKVARLRLVGIARQAMAAATAYVTPASYADLAGQAGRASTYRVVMRSHDERSIAVVTAAVEKALAQNRIGTRISITEVMLRKDSDGHFDLLIAGLLFISVLMALVGSVGLGSAMSSSVSERSREFGIMRCIGARSGVVLRNIVCEGVFIALLSLPLAILLALPISAAIGTFLGEMLFGVAFPLALSAKAVLIWIGLVLAGAVIASAVPAWKASRFTIQQSLSHL